MIRRFRRFGRSAVQLTVALLAAGTSLQAATVELKRDDAKGQLQVVIDGREALVYQYGAECDMAHCYPVRSPSGKLLTIQQTTPYPHHRSFWFGDLVQLAGREKPNSFYAPLYSQVDKKDPKSPYRDRIRHVRFVDEEAAPGGAAVVKAQLVWETDLGKAPVADEVRQMRIVALGGGEYFLDCKFTVTAAYGDATFRSDATHYAWPYIRIHPDFAEQKPTAPPKPESGKKAPGMAYAKSNGTITNSEGAVGEKPTLNKPARWVDYSATIDGVSEGLTIFADPQQPPPKFFTRGYGTFGPRRPDAQSGKPFVLKKGESLSQRVGVLVHSGDVKGGKVAERYAEFAAGKL